ncbi:MAG: ADP,ATP carrier protein 1 [Candidatus Omnitrophica bacterium ADurb.Bin277]|nr:MAG: ADP,ATP carrier protein 1 [Candidatus Omnitrophica bacterium ADurb.Bin277]
MKALASKLLFFIAKPFTEVRPEERTKTFLMFVYFFLTISTLYILKPVRSSLFLSEFSAEKLRYINIGEGIFLILVVWIYSILARRFSHRVLYPSVLGFLIAVFVAFWYFVKQDIPYLSAAFYIWQSAFSALVTTQFWILANDIFRPAEAKRLFGLIISGGSLGGILGGFLTSLAVKRFATEDLLLVVVFILLGCIFLIRKLWKSVEPDHIRRRPNTDKKDPETGGREAALAAEAGKHPFATVSYLALITGIIVIAKVSSTVVENQFSGVVQMAVQGKDALTAFYGNFYGWLNTVSLILQLVLTGKILKHFGVGISLWILPAGLTALSFVSILSPALFIGVFYKMFDAGMNYSIQQASKEILYLPVPAQLRRRVKPAIDMLGFRGAKTLAGIYMAFAAPALGLSVEKLGVLVLILMPVWFVLTWFIHRKLHCYADAGL